MEGMRDLGYNEGYLYPHDFPGHYVEQQYLPDQLQGTQFYVPTDNGYEAAIREHMNKIKEEAAHVEKE